MPRFLVACLLLAGVGSLLSCVTLVRSDERAVVRRFGRVLPEKPGPGLFLGLPWTMDQVNRVSVKERTVLVGWTDSEMDENSAALTPGRLLTGDHNLVNVQVVIEYRVDEERLEKFVLMEDRVEPLIVGAAEASLAEWLAGHEVDYALLDGKRKMESFLKTRVAARIVPYELGVHIQRTSVMLIEPPREVRDSFDLVSKEHSRIATMKNDAEREEARIKSEARQKVDRLESEIAAYMREQKLAAQADAENFLTRLAAHQKLRQDNPQHLNTVWLDEVTRIFGQMRRKGRLDVLDNYLGADGINITQFPLKKR